MLANIHSRAPSSPCFMQAVSAGFHTFDYARHFLSCCSRMLGLEHVTSRGSIMMEYYGRNVGVKILPTGVKPERFLSALSWQDTVWRRGELLDQVQAYPIQAPQFGQQVSQLYFGVQVRLGAIGSRDYTCMVHARVVSV